LALFFQILLTAEIAKTAEIRPRCTQYAIRSRVIPAKAGIQASCNWPNAQLASHTPPVGFVSPFFLFPFYSYPVYPVILSPVFRAQKTRFYN
jgi:hypothetical protein